MLGEEPALPLPAQGGIRGGVASATDQAASGRSKDEGIGSLSRLVGARPSGAHLRNDAEVAG